MLSVEIHDPFSVALTQVLLSNSACVNNPHRVQLHGSASRFLLFSFEKDPRKILMANDHAREKNKLFYAKTKASMCARRKRKRRGRRRWRNQ